MLGRAKSNEVSNPQSMGRAVASTLAVVGIALISDHLLKPPEERSESPSIVPHSGPQPGAGGDARGCQATTRSEIPAQGWKDILLRVFANISRHRVLALAAGMTYYSILAIFPAIAALVAVYSLFSDPSMIGRHLDELQGFLPGGAVDVAREQLTRIASKGSQALGLTFAIGFFISLWSANAAMKALFDTLNIVYGEDEKRGFLKLNAISLLFTVSGIIFVIAALGSIVVIPVVLNALGLSRVGELLVRIGRWPAMYLVIVLALSIIYRYGASRQAPQWRWTTWGSAFAALLWLC